MPRVIVCGADGSDESLAAVEVAARLARRLQGRLVVGQAINRPGESPYGDLADVERRGHRAGGEAADLFERVADRADDPELDGRVLHGEPAGALAELARGEDALLLVVGSRGRGGVRAALLGSTSLRLAAKTQRPVVIVPPAARGKAAARDPGPIVCGVDGSHPGIAAAVAASALARALGVELLLLHACEPFPAPVALAAPLAAPAADYERLQQRQRDAADSVLQAVAQGIGARQPIRTLAQAGEPVSVLAAAAAEHDAELIVVGTHGRSGVASALLGSTSTQIVAATATPVVVVPERSEQTLRQRLDSLSTTN